MRYVQTPKSDIGSLFNEAYQSAQNRKDPQLQESSSVSKKDFKMSPHDIFKRDSEASKNTLVDHSQHNLDTGKYKLVGDDVQTVYSATVEDYRLNSGKPTVIPLIWEGEERSVEEAIFRARLSDKKYPYAHTIEDANRIAVREHNRMAEQTANTKTGESYKLSELNKDIQQKQQKDTPIEGLMQQMSRIFVEAPRGPDRVQGDLTVPKKQKNENILSKLMGALFKK